MLKTRQKKGKNRFFKSSGSFLMLTALLAWPTGSALADVSNSASGSIGGLPGTLIGWNSPVTLKVVELAVEKDVRDSSGNFLGKAANVGAGSIVWFVVHINNITGATLGDVQLQDMVDTSRFEVQEITPNVHAEVLDIAGVNAGEESQKIGDNWNGAWQSVTDVGNDHAGVVTSGEYDNNTQTFTFGTTVTPSNIPPNTLRAYRIKVIVK